jgi:hypothetical protein
MQTCQVRWIYEAAGIYVCVVYLTTRMARNADGLLIRQRPKVGAVVVWAPCQPAKRAVAVGNATTLAAVLGRRPVQAAHKS